MNKENFIRWDGLDLAPLSYKVMSFNEFVDDLSDSDQSTFGRRHMEYGYRNWFQNANQSLWENSDQGFVPFQWDRLLVFDLLDQGSRRWVDAFQDDKFFPHLLENMQDIFIDVCQDIYESDSDHYIVRNAHSIIYNDSGDYNGADALTPAQVSYRGYGGDVHPFMAALNKTFNISPWQYPAGVLLDRGSDDYLRSKVHTDTNAARMWKTFPMRYFAIPLPSEEYTSYLSNADEEHSMSNSDYLWAGENGKFFQTTMNQGYYQADLHHHARWYDYASESWKVKEYNWGGRGVRECNCCRKMYSSHFMTWYKYMGGYGQNSRSRICFFCNTFTTTSYNPDKKCFVSFPREVSTDNTEGFGGMSTDFYVNYIHGTDSPTARGSRDYMLKFIDDDDYQDDQAFHSDIDVTDLQVDARKYLTWMYKAFKNVPGDIKSQSITDIVEYMIFDDETQTGRTHATNVGGYLDDEPISGAQQARLIGRGLPNAYIYASVNPLADTIISLRIDSLGDSRDFYFRSSRSARAAARVEDGWIEPPHIGLQLNKAKNEYGFTPRWHYVDYRAGRYYNYPTDAPTVNVPARDACECETDECRESNRAHPDRVQWHRTRGVSLGLELELVGRDSRLLDEVQWLQLFERTVEVFHPEGLMNLIGGGQNTQLLYAKRDGSLPSDSGVEYVSQPMTLDAWHAVPTKFWNFVEANYKAFNQSDVGIHIHFPWASMEVGHAYTMLSALNSLQINQHGILFNVAQRGDVSYARWDLLTMRDAYNVVAEVAKQRTRSDNEKYKAINLQHTDTIELRYFQSNAKGSRVLKNLEFVDALYELTKRDYQMTQGWNHEDDIPTIGLIEVATEYGNQSPKYKIDSIHPEEVPFANYIEKKLYEYVLERQDRYPNLVGFFAESDEDEDREITLDDIGYWEEVMEDEEREIALPANFINRTFVFESDHITVDGTQYTHNNT